MPTTFAEGFARFVRAPGTKFFVIGILCLILLIPASMVWMLVSERENRARDVASEIAQIWGGSQQISGPFLIVPYEAVETRTEDGEEVRETVRREAVYLPEALTVTADAASDTRTRGIFEVSVYGADVTLEGSFAMPSIRAITSDEARFLWTEARLVLGISNVRAIRNSVMLEVEGAEPRGFEPSFGGSAPLANGDVRQAVPSSGRPGVATGGAIHVPNLFTGVPRAFAFSIALEVNGSESLFVAPTARNTEAVIQSDWPHPSFTGAYLPETSTISETGFEANWQVPHLARAVPLAFTLGEGFGRQALSQDSFGVRFFQPVDYYALVDRAIKYAVLFIGVVFLAVFVLEVRGRKPVHVVQYVLVGLSLVLFYVLLLSLAEHLGFGLAYGIAAAATALLNAAYIGRALESVRGGLVALGALASVFGVLFLFLRMEDYALLAGSVFAFGVLAIVMFATQKIDWSGRLGAPDRVSAE